MTGKDLILYILQNKLENEPVIKNGKFIGFISAAEAAEKFEVGIETIKLWLDYGYIEGVKDGDDIYILSNATPM